VIGAVGAGSRGAWVRFEVTAGGRARRHARRPGVIEQAQQGGRIVEGTSARLCEDGVEGRNRRGRMATGGGGSKTGGRRERYGIGLRMARPLSRQECKGRLRRVSRGQAARRRRGVEQGVVGKTQTAGGTNKRSRAGTVAELRSSLLAVTAANSLARTVGVEARVSARVSLGPGSRCDWTL